MSLKTLHAALLALLALPAASLSAHAETAALSGEQLYLACASCHALSPDGAHKVGPNLYAAMGAPAASQEGFQYSPALKASGLNWDRATLIAWLAATEKLVPGTWMLFDSSTLLPEELPVLVDYLFAQTAAARGAPAAE